MSETRKLAAILVADVVGYSLLAGADEESANSGHSANNYEQVRSAKSGPSLPAT